MLCIILFLSHLYLLEQLYYRPLRDTGTQLTILKIGRVIVTLCIALHSECFSTSGLTVSKYCCVVTFNYLVDQSGDAKSSVNIFLLLIRRENLIKIVYFSTIYLRLVNVLAFIGVGLHNLHLVGATNY